jgi:hypothetical protein
MKGYFEGADGYRLLNVSVSLRESSLMKDGE